jgi:hypothetical protein
MVFDRCTIFILTRLGEKKAGGLGFVFNSQSLFMIIHFLCEIDTIFFILLLF